MPTKTTIATIEELASNILKKGSFAFFHPCGSAYGLAL